MAPAAGFQHIKACFDEAAQRRFVRDIQLILCEAPLFQPTMPRTGKPLSVKMSNCGALGWVSDKQGGYRYQANHPVTDKPWPKMPDWALEVWRDHAGYGAQPEACLINWYDAKAKMGLHKDQDEEDFDAPVRSISLGDRARFRIGGLRRSDSTQSVELNSGDLVILGGEARLCYHGVDRIFVGSSNIISGGGRVNLTLRRVTRV